MKKLSLGDNALTVLTKRYLLKDERGRPIETPEQMFRRVARNIALMDALFFPEVYDLSGGQPKTEPPETAEFESTGLEDIGYTRQDVNTLRMSYERLRREGHAKASFAELISTVRARRKELLSWEDRIYDLMACADFMFNSPTLMNAGRDLQQLSACFVLPVEDDLSKIFEALKQAALIHQSGGGTGFAFSRLRPRNDIVRSTGGVASGPVSFMKVFDAATHAVIQGGMRRGANMGILRVDHPDILQFITCKADGKEITNFNISVAVTDEFMTAVEEDGEYELINPRNREVTGTLRAREVFRLICENAWRNGDPGVVFIDRINRDNPTPQAGEIESTNPCVTGDTWVATSEGPRRARELVGERFEAIVNGEPVPAGDEGFFPTGIKSVLKLTTKEGFELRLTADHPVLRVVDRARRRIAREWVPAGQLCPGDKIALHDHRSLSAWPGMLTEKEGYRLGTLAAGKAVSSARKAAASRLSEGEFAETAGSAEDVESLDCWMLKLFDGDEAILTADIERASSEAYRGFLRGFFDATALIYEGGARNSCIRVFHEDPAMLGKCQRMLLRLGVASSVRPAEDGERSGCLTVSGDNILAFRERVGFGNARKASRLRSLVSTWRDVLPREKFVATVSSAKEDGIEEVYDVRVPGVNAFDANGFYVHNCGEQPLLPHEACTLGSINLGNFAMKGKRSRVDYPRLAKAIKTAIHALDNVLEANRYPIPEIEAMVRANRKVGLGVMGWADLLLRVGISYASEEALEFAEEVASFINRTASEASCALARERGAFPNWKGSSFDLAGREKRRNATVTTIAPTGTISIIAGASTGIEPLFGVAFTRHVLDGAKLLEINPVFEEVSKERGFYSNELMERIAESGSLLGLDEVPEDVRRLFANAHDISAEWHVRMQAAFQRHTENAVSKTINLPHDATVEDVSKAYFLAFKLGCKGITVYRDRSRETQVLTAGGKGETAQVSAVNGRWGNIRPIPRPPRLQGITDAKETPLGKLFLTLNLLGDRPVEMFAQIGKAGSDVSAFTEAIARLISLALRSGIAPDEVASQLTGIGGARSVGFGPHRVRSVPDAIGRFLADFIEDREGLCQDGSGDPNESQVRQGSLFNLCPSCGIYAFAFVDGCAKCFSCGYSEC